MNFPYRLSAVFALVLLLFSASLTCRAFGGTEAIDEKGFGPTQIGYVEATITSHGQPLRRGTLAVSLASLGEALPASPSCSAELGCGFVAAVKPGFTFNSCSPPDNNPGDFTFSLSGTFCQEPNGAWTYSGSFSVTSKGGNPAVGNGSIQAAAGANGQSIITLSGVLAQ